MLEPCVIAEETLAALADAVVEIARKAPARDVFRDLLSSLLEFAVGVRQAHSVEILRHRALRLGDAHAVVVEHDQELPVQGACAVQAFHREAVDDRRIADHGHDAAARGVLVRPALAIERVAARHAHGGADGRTGVAHAEEVVGALDGCREPGHATALAQLGQKMLATREQLVRVALMADVKEQSIVSEVEHVVHGHGQFDHAEVRREVATAARHLIADRGADLGAELLKLGDAQASEVCG